MEIIVCSPTKGGIYCGHSQAADPLWMWPCVLIFSVVFTILVCWLLNKIGDKIERKK